MARIFVGRNGANLGGFEIQAVRDGFTNGVFSKDDFGWTEGMTEWKPLTEVLAASANAIPPEPAKMEVESPKTYILKGAPAVSKDEHGQPRRLFKANLENNVSKVVDLLSGICTGILADGVVTDQEANFFRDWVQNHASMEPVWPLTDILDRVEKVFAHGKIDEEERLELAEIMRSICGQGAGEADSGETYSSRFPLDEPQPEIIFEGKEFVVTGRFAYGTRAKVTECIVSRKGIAKDRLSFAKHSISRDRDLRE